MIAAIDNTFLTVLLNPKAAPRPNPGTGQPVSHCRQRIEALIDDLSKKKGTLLVPAPALAEVLCAAGVDRRLAVNQSGKRKVVVIVRERNGQSVPAVFRTEASAQSWIKARIAKGTVVNADEATSWDNLHGAFEMKRINHQEAYSLDGACTNWAEEYFSRLRRAEIGHHHHVAGAYLLRYAQEASWREDHRRQSNGDQTYRIAGLALGKKTSPDFVGYWQRHILI